jgi:hypothetical protein
MYISLNVNYQRYSYRILIKLEFYEKNPQIQNLMENRQVTALFFSSRRTTDGRIAGYVEANGHFQLFLSIGLTPHHPTTTKVILAQNKSGRGGE